MPRNYKRKYCMKRTARKLIKARIIDGSGRLDRGKDRNIRQERWDGDEN
jgi:hypothetical protein